MAFKIVESNVLKVFKVPVQKLAGFAEHYYLSEKPSLQNSVGWGDQRVELYGEVKITLKELERVEQFTKASAYSIALNNCEHFANHILYGLSLSSQQNLWWKSLGAQATSLLQPVQSVSENYNSFMRQQIADVLSENLRQARIERINREHIDFWKSRGVNIK